MQLDLFTNLRDKTIDIINQNHLTLINMPKLRIKGISLDLKRLRLQEQQLELLNEIDWDIEAITTKRR